MNSVSKDMTIYFLLTDRTVKISKAMQGGAYRVLIFILEISHFLECLHRLVKTEEAKRLGDFENRSDGENLKRSR